SRDCVGWLPLSSPSLITGMLMPSNCSYYLLSGCIIITVSTPIASRVLQELSYDSPFCTADCDTSNVIACIPSLNTAILKLDFVRVDLSKNKLQTVVSCANFE